MGIDKNTLEWRERFEKRNEKGHKEIMKMIAKLDKNVLELNIRFEGLDEIKAICNRHEERLEKLERYKEKKSTQLKMINYFLVGAFWLITFTLALDKFFNLFSRH